MIRIWLAAVILLATVRFIASMPPTPDVYYSARTGECVKVFQGSETNYSCSNLPSKYNKVWVR